VFTTAFVYALTAAVAIESRTHAIHSGAVKATLGIPKHELVTVTASPVFVFFSVKAGYPQPEDGPYANIPGEMNVRIIDAPMEKAIADQRKILINATREIGREVKLGDQVIWLLVQNTDPATSQTLRAVQFVPVTTPAGAKKVLMIDATSMQFKGMPPRARKQIDDLLATGLKGVTLNGNAVSTAEVLKYLNIK
jgi:hypothetical protein